MDMKENFNGKELGLTMDNEKLTELPVRRQT